MSPSLGPIAWGKVILLGEHAVVYGHQAIAGAIHRGVQCQVTAQAPARLCIPAWNVDVKPEDDHPVARAFQALLSTAESGPLQIEAKTDLPAAAGLGSSAALCIAIARVLCPQLQGSGLEALAHSGEACFHEDPSGVDVALSARGGIGLYRKATGLEPISCLALPLVVGLSGVARSTADMVTGVGQRLRDDPSLESIMQAIAGQVSEGHKALLAGDLDTLGQLMNQNQLSLQALGVCNDTLAQMVHAAQAAGALGAKLTGAGGGGAMIALAPDRQEDVQQALAVLGYESFITTLGANT